MSGCACVFLGLFRCEAYRGVEEVEGVCRVGGVQAGTSLLGGDGAGEPRGK